MANRRSWAPALVLSCCAALLAFVLAVMVGSHSLDFTKVINKVPPDYEIFINLRLPRAILAVWAGGSLALAGVLFQALLRESLATPYTLGVSGGASLGAVIAICSGWG